MGLLRIARDVLKEGHPGLETRVQRGAQWQRKMAQWQGQRVVVEIKKCVDRGVQNPEGVGGAGAHSLEPIPPP